MNNQPKKPLKKKDKLARMISKLNILEKLLNQPMVSVRKALGDSELVDEVNKELKMFIQQQMDFIFNPESIQLVTPFTDQEIGALKEMASNHAKASTLVRTLPVDPVTPEIPAPVVPRPQFPSDRYGQPEDPNMIPPFVPPPAPVEPVAPAPVEKKKKTPKVPFTSKSHVQEALLDSYGIDITDPKVSMTDRVAAMRKLEADNREKDKKKE